MRDCLILYLPTFFNKMSLILRLYRTLISEDLSTASEDCRRFRKTSEDRRRFPTTSEDLPTTSEDYRRYRKIFDVFNMASQFVKM